MLTVIHILTFVFWLIAVGIMISLFYKFFIIIKSRHGK